MEKNMKRKPVQDFIEEYVEGEPLNPKMVGWAIKKYLNMNFSPTPLEQVIQYENVLHALNEASQDPEKLAKLMTNIQQWADARNFPDQDVYKVRSLANETFHNLLEI